MPYSPTAGLPFDDEELESRLVWIWGSPRSGSTWLLRLLAHPLTVDDHAPLGFHQPPDSPQARLLPVNESFLTNHLAPLLQAHAADLVMSICRRSRLIFLVRDGRDVLDSLMHAIGPGGFLFGGRSAFQGSKERSEWVRRNSNNWVGDMKTIQRAYDAHPPELRRTVSYEALREDTAATLGPLAEWLGLRHDAGWLEDAIESNAFEGVPKRERGPTSFFRSARPGAWKQKPHEQGPPSRGGDHGGEAGGAGLRLASPRCGRPPRGLPIDSAADAPPTETGARRDSARRRGASDRRVRGGGGARRHRG